MSNNNFFITLAGIGALALSAYAALKATKTAEKINMSIDKIADATPVDISEKVVEAAVAKAADREVHEKVRLIADAAVNDIRSDIDAQVRQTIKDAYGDVKDGVRDKLEEKVGTVNIDRVRNEVIEKAKKQAAEKFETDLKGVLDIYNNNLRQVNNIYTSMANALPGAMRGVNMFQM